MNDPMIHAPLSKIVEAIKKATYPPQKLNPNYKKNYEVEQMRYRIKEALASLGGEESEIATEYASQQTQWISVEDRLPEPFKEVIVSDGIEVRSGFYDSDFKKMEMRKRCQFKAVTHWQPLPEPPNSNNIQAPHPSERAYGSPK